MKVKKSGLQGYVLAAVFAALISLCAFISLPFSPPITLQTCGIFLSLLVLGGKFGSISVSIYVLLGILGLPIFSGFTGGIGALLSANGGYIIGFLVLALLFWLIESLFSKSAAVKIGIPLGIIFIYILGALWFFYVNGNEDGFLVAFLTLTLPFVIPDLLKFSLSILIARRIEKAKLLEKIT